MRDDAAGRSNTFQDVIRTEQNLVAGPCATLHAIGRGELLAGATLLVNPNEFVVNVKNAIERPSGDQNGYRAPSVPSITTQSVASNRRSQSRGLPSADNATKTTRVPSGEMAISAVARGKMVPFGGSIVKLTRGDGRAASVPT